MKFNKSELWTLYMSLVRETAFCRAMDYNADKYTKLAKKIEKELLK